MEADFILNSQMYHEQIEREMHAFGTHLTLSRSYV